MLTESCDSVIRAYAQKEPYRRSGQVAPEERERTYALCEGIVKEKDGGAWFATITFK